MCFLSDVWKEFLKCPSWVLGEQLVTQVHSCWVQRVGWEMCRNVKPLKTKEEGNRMCECHLALDGGKSFRVVGILTLAPNWRAPSSQHYVHFLSGDARKKKGTHSQARAKLKRLRGRGSMWGMCFQYMTHSLVNSALRTKRNEQFVSEEISQKRSEGCGAAADGGW